MAATGSGLLLSERNRLAHAATTGVLRACFPAVEQVKKTTSDGTSGGCAEL